MSRETPRWRSAALQILKAGVSVGLLVWLFRQVDADHVAADVAGQEVVEEGGHEEGADQGLQTDDDALRPQQDVPAPAADHQHDEI